jgi:hypothetical protein
MGILKRSKKAAVEYNKGQQAKLEEQKKGS